MKNIPNFFEFLPNKFKKVPNIFLLLPMWKYPLLMQSNLRAD